MSFDPGNRPKSNKNMFLNHRNKALLEARNRNLKGCFLVYGLKEPGRPHSDHEPAFRQESCFFWLTGVNEPDFVLYINIESGRTVLFCPEIPQSMVIWCGELPTINDLKNEYGFDEIRLAHSLDKFLADEKPTIIHSLPETCYYEGGIKVNKDELVDIVGELRQIKSDDEMEYIKYACRVNSQALCKVMKKIRPGMFEFNVEALLVKEYMDWYCRESAFTTIVCSGENCSILHYHKNNRQIKDGELVLIDTGCEYNCYSSDNTRTIPANGKFTDDQKLIYQAVLDCHNWVIKNSRAGESWPDIAYKSAIVMAEGLIKAGLFHNGTAQEIVDSESLAVFYPHGLGHGMGLDTHEIAGWPRGSKKPQRVHSRMVRYGRNLEAGTVITNEPGCYFIKPLYEEAFKDPVKSKYINKDTCLRFRTNVGGVRIEDDLYITKDGCIVLSDIPKEIDEIEKLMASRKQK